MSYTPTEWESTDVVTATRMNALEQAVGDMNMSYTPNVWSDGDILSAEKMNALEQAVASGGGGSSDFSTATVTLVNNTDDYAVLEFPKVASLPSGTYTTASSPDGDPHATEEVVIALAEDGCVVLPAGITGNIAVSGDATIGDRGMIIITGDCTITIS